MSLARLRDAVARPALPPRYDPVEVIGRGGMGVVWRAHDRELDRDVAVKVLAEHVDDPSLEARLRREARILARLEHPGIVAVHDAGTFEDGGGWYAMRLVRGEALDVAARRWSSPGDVLRVMERLCETVAYAHAKGVLHRDLKPGNVMLGPFGEVLVLDWGVARAAEPVAQSAARQEAPLPGAARRAGAPVSSAVSSPTTSGTAIGTPGYMSPEQASGLAADVRSDVYGLGAILRDLLAAQAPPVPRALAAIRDKALAQAPADRYPDATALATDLRRFQDGEPVSAYRERPWERLGRVASRYRTPIALVTAYLIMRMAILVWRGI